MKPATHKRLLLNIAIVLLIAFNGMQLYGIFSLDRPSSEPVAAAVNDTTHVPLQINVLNGCGVNGVGSVMTTFCRRSGYDVVEMGNYRTFDVEHSIVIDRSGKMTEAIRLAGALGIARNNVVQQFSNDQMVSASVVIGKDYQSLTPWK
ncbi:MAG: LytR C-terminal domain-containing protein [Bacteroidota bacterium]